MKAKIIILTIVAIALSLSMGGTLVIAGAKATVTPIPAKHLTKPVAALRQAFPGQDRGRTNLLHWNCVFTDHQWICPQRHP